MSLSSSMAAAFFLQSLDNDKELSSLCQTLYDIKPFDLNTITDMVLIEHSRWESTYDQELLVEKNKQVESSKPKGKRQLEGGRKKKGFKEKITIKGQGGLLSNNKILIDRLKELNGC
ncbi:hypothetical protein O181_046683 [Austropuccinia psidii MF-1]|uniref:Uncharacterized protein n=1 Tax=Austropuccinia psidii MF-1 TaxID=1389203 RepID=A0A9Q3DUL1_9BASI|nr:hypothetical protein [Austropuccinia psidii MF-1]